MTVIEDGFRWLFAYEPMRRDRAEWMTGSDDRILEFLSESGAGHNLRGIQNNFEERGESLSYATLKRRIPKLEDAGLVYVIEGEGQYYAITEKGEEYLRGETDLREEPEP
ncbi:winged-helix domain-containing protein [Haloarcula argentinensis]|uniref:ArsR family transcriptional regulator n=1 Tax=Haloarcula argentinensis TaxID=43776 RepID=A0ABU2EYA8_HALAR|nr:winged-helix domain-containing protein [Haloarcula argentinensis]EMA24622.1 phage PhiH1 repressor protein-like protein [Haloarcula argentinensis DSM 12282]MDS0253262.1 ArsR family transcriptional regulator [Haloarcula argentinensis]